MTILRYRQALETARRLLGAYHPFVGKILYNIAQTYKSHRNWKLAEQAAKEAVKIFKESNHMLRGVAEKALEIIITHRSSKSMVNYFTFSHICYSWYCLSYTRITTRRFSNASNPPSLPCKNRFSEVPTQK